MLPVFATDRSWHLLFQRVVLGAVLLPHGLQKTLGWFGGFGFDATMDYFTGHLGLPWLVAFLVIATESLGAVGLIVGAGTRLAALGTIATMLGAIAMAHLPFGFFMNWSGAQGGEGFEYHLLALGLGLPLAISGGGLASVDAAIAEHLPRGRRAWWRRGAPVA